MDLGIFDINGDELKEGHRVVVYPKRYANAMLKNGIIMGDIENLRPLVDLPIGSGRISYSPSVAAFKVYYDKPTENGIIYASMSDWDYHYEIIK